MVAQKSTAKDQPSCTTRHFVQNPVHSDQLHLSIVPGKPPNPPQKSSASPHYAMPAVRHKHSISPLQYLHILTPSPYSGGPTAVPSKLLVTSLIRYPFLKEVQQKYTSTVRGPGIKRLSRGGDPPHHTGTLVMQRKSSMYLTMSWRSPAETVSSPPSSHSACSFCVLDVADGYPLQAFRISQDLKFPGQASKVMRDAKIPSL